MFNRVSEFTLHLVFIVLATLYLPFFVGKNFFSPIYDSYLKLDSPAKWISFTNEDDYYRKHFADFAEQEVSYKPDNWSSEKPAEGVKGAMLEHANLDYAYAHSAFLIKAKLSRASLKDATLTGAILVGAMLDGKADLTNAHLDKANLIGANLTEAILSGVDFTGADLTGANLYKADLTRADLTGVIGIKPEQIKKAKDWQLAFYDRNFNEKHLKLSDGGISNALDAFMRAKYPTLSNEEAVKLYEKEMKKYRVHYGWSTGEKAK